MNYQKIRNADYGIQKNSRIKDFLINHSKLVRLNEKALIRGNGLTKTEAEKENRLYELRDKAFQQAKEAIASYYEKVTGGSYLYDGMPEIDRGIRGWIERKIWRLLVEIGDPDNLRFKNEKDEESYWEEAWPSFLYRILELMKNIQEYKERLEKYDQQNQKYYLRLDFVGSHRQNKKWRCNFDRPNFKSFADYWQRIEQGVNFMEAEGMGILWDAQVYSPNKNY